MRSRLLEFADGQLAEAACFSNKLCDVSVDGHVCTFDDVLLHERSPSILGCQRTVVALPKKVRPRPGHVLILPFPSAIISMLHLWAVRLW